MIYTLTLNPAIDRFVEVLNFELGKTNKIINEYELIGGKGINVSIMLKNLGYQTVVLGFLGFDNKEIFEKYLLKKKINFYFQKINGKNRINLKIKNLKSKQETELNGISFCVIDKDIITLLTTIKKKITKNDCLIISGSLPKNCSINLYKKISSYCYKNKILFIVDATKDILLSTLSFKPFLIKPNLIELNELFKTNFEFINKKEIINLGKKLQKKGAQNILISCGKDGSILITSKYIYIGNSAKGKLINSVGSGDSMIAGFIGTYLKTNNYKLSMLKGICSGSATAFSKGIANKLLVENLKKQIKINIF